MAIISDGSITAIAYASLGLSTCSSVAALILETLLMKKLKAVRPKRWHELHTVSVDGREQFSSRTGIEGFRYAWGNLDSDEPGIGRLKKMFRACFALTLFPIGILFISIILRIV